MATTFTNQTKNTPSFTNQSKNTPSFINSSKNTPTFANASKNTPTWKNPFKTRGGLIWNEATKAWQDAKNIKGEDMTWDEVSQQSWSNQTKN